MFLCRPKIERIKQLLIFEKFKYFELNILKNVFCLHAIISCDIKWTCCPYGTLTSLGICWAFIYKAIRILCVHHSKTFAIIIKKLRFSNGICTLCHFFLSLAFESYDLSGTYASSSFYLISVYGTLSLQYLNYMFMNVSALWKRQNEHQMVLRTNNLGSLVSLTTWTGSL